MTGGDGLRFEKRMSDLEALMWALERTDPRMVPAMTMVAVLDQAPDPGHLTERLERLTRRIPRLRDRVAAGPLPMVPPRWERTPRFDASRHVRRQPAGGTGSFDDLLAAAAVISATPFPARRPPWEMVLVEGLECGHQGLILKLHHSYTDGLGAVKLALELFDVEASPALDPAPLPDLPGIPGRTPFGPLWDDLAYEGGRAAGALLGTVPWAAAALRDTARDPWKRAGSAAELLESLRYWVHQASGPGSPVMVERSGGVWLGALELTLSELRQAARRAEVSVNDVFLTALLGGLGLYHAKHGADVPTLRVGIPVSTRPDEGTEMRNQFDALLIRGPLRPADPVERARLVHQIVHHARSRPGAGLLAHGPAVALHVPGARELIAAGLRSMDLMASNLPGPPIPLFLAGARLDRIVPIGPRSGAALNVTLLSHCQSVQVGINADPAAVPDGDLLLDCVRAGFDEVVGA
jgi:diacylglycerol O-acyltransferase / wax synthase